jgi:hypothetical protein
LIDDFYWEELQRIADEKEGGFYRQKIAEALADRPKPVDLDAGIRSLIDDPDVCCGMSGLVVLIIVGILLLACCTGCFLFYRSIKHDGKRRGLILEFLVNTVGLVCE